MNSDQPNTVSILLIILFGLAVAATLAVYGGATLARRGIGRSDLGVRLRGGAAFSGAMAALMYAWGALHLVRDETMTDQACKQAVPSSQTAHITGADVSYLPLHLNCHITGGGSYPAAVPDYVNPSLLGFALIAIVLGVFATLESELSARNNFKKEESS
ncbi:hypothetical protein ACWDDN_10750 [Streptomyces griseoruber]